MIRVGWVPGVGRARRKLVLKYERVRKAGRSRRVRDDSTPPVDARDVRFSAQDLPIATLHAHGMAAWLAGASAWLRARASWLRPRAIPMTVAFAGMFAVLATVDYLTAIATARPTAVPSISNAVVPDAHGVSLERPHTVRLTR